MKIYKALPNIQEYTMYKKYTIERDQYASLRRMYFNKVPLLNIGSALKISIGRINAVIARNKWYKKRERYYRMMCKLAYRNRKQIKHLCRDLGLCYSYAKSIKHKYKIKTRIFVNTFPTVPHNKILNSDIEKQIISQYLSGLNAREVAINNGFKTHKTVCDVLKKHNIERRPNKKITNYNIDFFHSINSQEKAYILGLILSDGYIIKDYKGFGIQITKGDKYLLDEISILTGKSTSVIDLKHKHIQKMFPSGKKYYHKAMVRLSCYCSEMAKDLKKHCVVRNKSKILRCPKINKMFLGHFCRGLIDGDGSIGIGKNNHLWVKLCSASIRFCEDFVKMISNFSLKIYKTKTLNEMYNIYVMKGNGESIRFLNWMYKDKGVLYLRRKYEKVQNFIN